MNLILGISRAGIALCGLSICFQLSMVTHAAEVNSVWSGGNGDWSVAGNWTPNNRYPNDGNGGHTYDVRLNSGTITLTEPISIQQFTNLGAILAGPFPLTVNDLFTWSGGPITDNAPLHALGGAALIGSTKTLEGRTLNIGGGIATWSAGVINSGSGASLSVQPGAEFVTDFDGTFSVTPAGTTTISNWGTIRKIGGTNSAGTAISAVFFNQPDGLVQVTSGILSLRGGGNNSGTFDISEGATLSFSGGDHLLDPGSSLTGSGTNRVTTGSLGVAGAYDFPEGSTVVSGGSFSFDGPNPNAGNLFPGHVDVSGGTLSFDSASAAMPLSELNLTGGTLRGSDSLEVSGPMTWTGGTISGSGLIKPMAGMTMDGAGTKILTERTLSLPAGTTNLWLQGGISSGLGAVFNIEPAAEFHITFDGNFVVASGSSATITNSGAFRKLDGTNVTGITVPLINVNPGLVEAASGTLSLNGGGGGDGTYAARRGAMLRFGGGSHSLGIASQVEGDGTNNVSTGTVTFGGNYNVSGDSFFTGGATTFIGPVGNLGLLTMSGNPGVYLNTGGVVPATGVNLLGGILGSNDTIEVSGPFTWSGGRLDGAGSFEVNGGALLNGVTKTISARTLNLNSNTTVWSVGNISSSAGAVVNNASLFDVTFDGSFLGATTFNNTGILRKSSGSGITTLAPAFNNTDTGRLEVQVGTVSLTGGGNSSGQYEVAEGAVLAFGGGNHTLSANASIAGAGTNTVTTGSLNVEGTYNVTGGTRVTGGTATFSGPDVTVGALMVSGGTAAFSGDGMVNSVSATIAGGTLNSATPLHIAEQLNWTGGTIAGLGPIYANGPTTLSGSLRTLHGRLHINAPAVWSAGNIGSGQGAALTIEEFATLDTTFDGAILFSGGGSSAITNRGTFRKAGGVGALGTVINPAFHNGLGAMVDVAAGSLSLNGGGNSSGAFIIAEGSSLRFGGGSNSMDSVSSITGAGTSFFTAGNTFSEGSVNVTGGISVSGGTATFAGPVAGGAPITVSGGTANFTGSVSGEPRLTVSGGQANFNSSSSIAFTTVDLMEGGIGGTNDFSFSGPFTWTGGTLSGSGNVLASEGATFSGSAHTLSGRTLILPAGKTASWTAGNFSVLQNATLDNAGALDIAFDGQFNTPLNQSATLANSGSIRKTSGNGTATIGASLNNDGSLEVSSGRLDLSGGGTSAGTFTAAANTTLGFVSSSASTTHNLGSQSSISGSGIISLDGGTINLGGTYDVAGTSSLTGSIVNFTPGARIISLGSNPTISGATVNFDTGSEQFFPTLTLSAGAMGGSDAIHVTDLFSWSGGRLNGTNVLNALGGAALDGANHRISAQTLNLFGTSTWNAGAINTDNGAVLHLHSGAILETSFDGQIGGNNLTGGITNAGTFRKTGGSGATLFTSRLDNLGTIEVNSGLLDFSSRFVQTDGSTLLNGGNLNVGQGFELLGGSLTGSGTVTGFITNAAIVDPGAPIGILNVNGELRQGPTGIVNIDLGGTEPGISHDQINLTLPGIAILTGTLNVHLIDGFMPNIGDSFRVLNYAYPTGEFTNYVGMDLGVADRHLRAIYDSTGLSLVTREGPLPPDVPTLSIRFLQPDTLEFTWHEEFIDFNLTTTTNLFAPTWLPLDTQGTNAVFITIDPAEPERHFRLEEPQ